MPTVKLKSSDIQRKRTENSPNKVCEIHGKAKDGEWCASCRTILRRAESSGDRSAPHATRLAIRVERWRLQGREENIRVGMMQTAVKGMPFLYAPDGIRPDGSDATILKEEDKWVNRPEGWTTGGNVKNKE